MAIGTVTIGKTPCCGLIERTYEAWPDSGMTTGIRHRPGAWGLPVYVTGEFPRGDQVDGPYTPTFEDVAAQIDGGICPDCGKRFR